MKIKYFKRALMVVLALAMLFSLSMVSFADDDPQVHVILREATYNTTTHQYSYADLDSFDSVLTATNTNVYTVLNGEYGSAAHWNNASGNMYLEDITIGNVIYEDIRHEAADSCFNDPDYEWVYTGGDTIIDSLNQLPEFYNYGCVRISWARLFEDDYYEGYYYLGNGQYSCSITYDWMYEVDYAADGYGNFVNPGVVMSSCNLSDGDIVRLTYGLTWVIW